jgi:hypothetical protein
MRPATLRSLIKELRAGGVSEFSVASKRETVTLKLAGPFPIPAGDVSASRGRASAKAAAPLPRISDALRQQLAELGVKPEDCEEVLTHSGMGLRQDA